MVERKQHSLKSDLIVGIGGLGLAFAAAAPQCFSDFKEQYVGNDNDIIVLYGGVIDLTNPDCVIDTVNQNVTCKPDVETECIDRVKTLLVDEESIHKNWPENCTDLSIHFERDWK
jgi:hypothetical protein